MTTWSMRMRIGRMLPGSPEDIPLHVRESPDLGPRAHGCRAGDRGGVVGPDRPCGRASCGSGRPPRRGAVRLAGPGGRGHVGLCLVVGALRRRVASFNAEGTATALATVSTLATLSLVLPRFTTSTPGPEFSAAQLVFAAVASIALYGLFVVIQTVRHRDYFLPDGVELSPEEHADPPSVRQAIGSLALLVVALVAVIGLAKVESPAIEDAVDAIGAPPSAVGVVIALLVLAPETLAAVRNAPRDRVQTSFNLAYGSAMASIGLTIPAIAVASIWLEGPLELGLGSTQIVLLVITIVVGLFTVLPGRATLQAGGVHLV